MSSYFDRMSRCIDNPQEFISLVREVGQSPTISPRMGVTPYKKQTLMGGEFIMPGKSSITRVIAFRVQNEDFEVIERRADKRDMNPHQWAKDRILNGDIKRKR